MGEIARENHRENAARRAAEAGPIALPEGPRLTDVVGQWTSPQQESLSIGVMPVAPRGEIHNAFVSGNTPTTGILNGENGPMTFAPPIAQGHLGIVRNQAGADIGRWTMGSDGNLVIHQVLHNGNETLIAPGCPVTITRPR